MVGRMPWHDVDVQLFSVAAADVALNFIQRWNHHKDTSYPTLELRAASQDTESFADMLANYPLPVQELYKGNSTFSCQVLRSLSAWSGSPNGFLEDSIYSFVFPFIFPFFLRSGQKLNSINLKRRIYTPLKTVNS